MREKRLKLFLYDVSINYGGRIEITDNLLLLLNTFIGNISSKEELQRFLLVFNHEKTDDGYCKVKYLTKELIEANDSLENETIESILNGISNDKDGGGKSVTLNLSLTKGEIKTTDDFVAKPGFATASNIHDFVMAYVAHALDNYNPWDTYAGE